MYILKLKEQSIELDTSYEVIERIQKRTNSTLEKIAGNYVTTPILDRYNLLLDGLEDQTQRSETLELFKKQLPLAKLNMCLIEFLEELMFDGLTAEEREEINEKNLAALQNPNRL